MLRGLGVLLLCQVLGEFVVALSGLPVPGPVVGLVVLFCWLQWRRPAPEAGTVRVAEALLRHLQLFFVPAGVGVVAYAALLRDDALPIGVALLGSWLAGLLVVGWIVQFAVGFRPPPTEASGSSGPGGPVETGEVW